MRAEARWVQVVMTDVKGCVGLAGDAEGRVDLVLVFEVRGREVRYGTMGARGRSKGVVNRVGLVRLRAGFIKGVARHLRPR